MSFLSVIFLAAGSSVRMETQKQLLCLEQKPLFLYGLEKYLKSECDEVILVTGYNSNKLLNYVTFNEKLKTVFNKKYLDGMGSSIASGISCVSPKSDGVMITFCDMPLISVEFINSFIAFWKKNPEFIAAPFFNEKRGNPVIFPKSLFFSLQKLDGDKGGSDIVFKNQNMLKKYETFDESIFFDVDTKKDWKQFINGLDKYKERLK